jgi:hypothetical protein
METLRPRGNIFNHPNLGAPDNTLTSGYQEFPASVHERAVRRSGPARARNAFIIKNYRNMADEFLRPPSPPRPFIGREAEMHQLQSEAYKRERRYPDMPIVSNHPDKSPYTDTGDRLGSDHAQPGNYAGRQSQERTRVAQRTIPIYVGECKGLSVATWLR